jgi:hypothetical protein
MILPVFVVLKGRPTFVLKGRGFFAAPQYAK